MTHYNTNSFIGKIYEGCDMEKYFAVKCKAGHVRRGNYIPIEFAIKANSAKQAAEIARWFPRVKHHDKHCILSVRTISRDEYWQIRKKNNKDPYLKCRSRKDQNCIDISERIQKETKRSENKKQGDDEQKSLMYVGKTRIKHPKRYMKFNVYAQAI